jgi:hypothetical protein
MKHENDSSTHIALRTARRAQWMTGIALFLMVISFGAWRLNLEWNELRQLRIYQTNAGDVSLQASNNGPFVVTHLVYYGFDEPSKRVAALQPPLAIIDSAGERMTRNEIARLVWFDHRGNRTNAPRASEKYLCFIIGHLRPIQ